MFTHARIHTQTPFEVKKKRVSLFLFGWFVCLYSVSKIKMSTLLNIKNKIIARIWIWFEWASPKATNIWAASEWIANYIPNDKLRTYHAQCTLFHLIWLDTFVGLTAKSDGKTHFHCWVQFICIYGYCSLLAALLLCACVYVALFIALQFSPLCPHASWCARQQPRRRRPTKKKKGEQHKSTCARWTQSNNTRNLIWKTKPYTDCSFRINRMIFSIIAAPLQPSARAQTARTTRTRGWPRRKSIELRHFSPWQWVPVHSSRFYSASRQLRSPSPPPMPCSPQFQSLRSSTVPDVVAFVIVSFRPLVHGHCPIRAHIFNGQTPCNEYQLHSKLLSDREMDGEWWRRRRCGLRGSAFSYV